MWSLLTRLWTAARASPGLPGILLDDQVDGVTIDPVVGVLPIHPRSQRVHRQGWRRQQLTGLVDVADLEWCARGLLGRFVVPGAVARAAPLVAPTEPLVAPTEPLVAVVALDAAGAVVAGGLDVCFDELHAPAISTTALTTLASNTVVLRPLRSITMAPPP